MLRECCNPYRDRQLLQTLFPVLQAQASYFGAQSIRSLGRVLR